MGVVGLGGIGLIVIQGARRVGANMIVGVDTNPAKQALGERFGMTHFVNPKEVEGDLAPYIVDLTGGGADYSCECIGNVTTMRQALECAHKGGGESEDYRRRQDQFEQAEIKALMDTAYFIERAERLYGYPNFSCDTGGASCEWADPDDPYTDEEPDDP